MILFGDLFWKSKTAGYIVFWNWFPGAEYLDTLKNIYIQTTGLLFGSVNVGWHVLAAEHKQSRTVYIWERRGGLLVRTMDFGSRSGLDSQTGLSSCVLRQDTLLSQCLVFSDKDVEPEVPSAFLWQWPTSVSVSFPLQGPLSIGI